MPKSWNATSTAPFCAACVARAMVSLALKAGSATRQTGTPTATRAKPWEYRLKNGFFISGLGNRTMRTMRTMPYAGGLPETSLDAPARTGDEDAPFYDGRPAPAVQRHAVQQWRIVSGRLDRSTDGNWCNAV